MKKTFYITTPIYYVNAKPHIGHAYTSIVGDTLARFYRMEGRDVLFLTGTDEHGQKIVQAAQAQGNSLEAFIDSVVQEFTQLWKELHISYDDFIRTTEPRHIEAVQKMLGVLYAKGDIYEGEYEGWYCTPCERFWPKNQLEEGKFCPDCQRPVEHLKEKNYFFKLSAYQKWLVEYIKTHEGCIQPVTRAHEVLSFLQQPLEDLCISRPRDRMSWGIELPFNKEYVTYVWFDALINYIAAVEYRKQAEKFTHFWPANVHLIGKDIIRQHAVFWPIMLHAAGLEPALSVFAHGWWLQEGGKISKSKGKPIDPKAIVSEYGVDALRYFLLREIPFGLDGEYSEHAFKIRYNSDLANDLGNLLNRTLTMVEKYFEGKIPVPGPCTEQEHCILDLHKGLVEKVQQAVSVYEFNTALMHIWELVNRANKYIEEAKPWALAKENDTLRLATVMYTLLEVLRVVTILIRPFMPETAGKIGLQLGFSDRLVSMTCKEASLWGLTPSDVCVCKKDPLFPRKEK